jgi:hypothetical protein
VPNESVEDIVKRSETNPISDLGHCLTDLDIWMRRTVQNIETRGHSDNSGHPHTYAVCLCPEWEMRQKMDVLKMARDIVAELEKESDVDDTAGRKDA